MSKEQKITNDIKVPNKDLEVLRLNFPHCFDKDGNFQLEKFKNSLTENEINFSTESYGMDWLGKSYARLLASDPATTLLKADETHNSKPENANAENLLIKGDNLEVLKHLANAYYEQVKMIYIDPPYNTGSDGFVYEDDRKFTVKELQNLIGVDADKAKRILDFTQQKSNSHSAWLTFLYPRLYIAKQLLKDDGVIFVSIDDNEVAQLRLLMDEIFGEENFLVEIIWKKRSTPPNDQIIGTNHDYILVYSKNKDSIRLNLRIRNEEQINRYQNPDNHPKGPWTSGDLMANVKGGRFVQSLHFGIVNPKTNEEHFPSNNGNWRFNKDKILQLIEQNEIYFGENGKGRPKLKRFLIDVKNGITYPTIWDFVPFNTEGSNEMISIFKSMNVFDNPKPTSLIKEILKLGVDKDSIVLDFFAGSGTTGDAVMQLNAEDGGNRKFILVQWAEAIDPKKNKAAYDFVKEELKAAPTIFEITKERLLRAAQKINAELESKIQKLKSELPTEENKAEIEKAARCKTQNVFKIFETTPIWEDYNFEAEQFDPSQTLFDAGKLTAQDIKALLTTWKTYDGIALTQELERIDLDAELVEGYTAYYGNGKLYLMNKGFATEHLKSLLEKIDTDKYFEPKSIIAFGYHLESKSLREIAENVKTYNNKKKSDIDFITRY